MSSSEHSRVWADAIGLLGFVGLAMLPIIVGAWMAHLDKVEQQETYRMCLDKHTPKECKELKP